MMNTSFPSVHYAGRAGADLTATRGKQAGQRPYLSGTVPATNGRFRWLLPQRSNRRGEIGLSGNSFRVSGSWPTLSGLPRADGRNTPCSCRLRCAEATGRRRLPQSDGLASWQEWNGGSEPIADVSRCSNLLMSQ